MKLLFHFYGDENSSVNIFLLIFPLLTETEQTRLKTECINIFLKYKRKKQEKCSWRISYFIVGNIQEGITHFHLPKDAN